MFSNMRIGGLASGMDIDSIVEDLMKAHRMPVQKLEQDKQILEWQQEDYREINTALRSFRDTAFDMQLQSTYMAMNASSSDESVITATANANALPGTYTVTVKNLATGVFKGSQSELSDEIDDGKIKTLQEQFGLDPEDYESGKISFTLQNGQDSDGEDVSDYKTHEFTFDIDTQTIFDVVYEINNAKLGIKASYDTELNRFFLATESTGKTQNIVVSEDPHKFLSGDDETGDNTLKLAIKTGETYYGSDAEYSFGDLEDLTSPTNKVTINGITMELKEGGDRKSAITVTNNTDAVFDSIVKFVNEYNNITEKIGDKLHETRYKDYKPLTDDQRQQLTDDQIDQWIKKSRSGLLRGDSILSNIYTQMRRTMSAVVDTSGSEYDRLSGIGITTTADYMSGKLVINEDKLRQAVENDPEGIKQLFTYNPDSEEYTEMGIAQRLYEDVNNAMRRISEKAGTASDYSLVDDSLIGERIDDIEKEIERKNQRLEQLQNRYWNQFTAMEKAIQQMNQQSMWLAQQMGL